MDVLFQPTRGRPFTIEVGFFDTVSEIKEKIQKDQGIPVPAQTLLFNGNILQDDLNIHESEILDRSHIQLMVEVEDEDTNNEGHLPQNIQYSTSPSKKIILIVKMGSMAKPSLKIEMEPDETIRKLKEKIHELEGLPINQLVLHGNGNELRDNSKTLRDFSLSDCSEVEVSLRASSTSSSGSSGGTNGTKRLKITILTKCGTKKIPLEVSPSQNVADLRKELQKLCQSAQLELPPEGYFFIYKQNVMDDDRSIRWHQVGQGDTIEIFNGSVTGGS